MDFCLFLLLCFIYDVVKIESVLIFVIPNHRDYSYCPSWPCLHIDEIPHYFRSSLYNERVDTNLVFFPEIYILISPVIIADVHNVTFFGEEALILFEWEQTHGCPKQRSLCITEYISVLNETHEWCCSMFRFTNVKGVTIRNFYLGVADHISGIIIEDSNGIIIKNVHLKGKQKVNNVGLLLSESRYISASNIKTVGIEVGILMTHSNDTGILNAWIVKNGKIGIYAINTLNIQLKMLTLSHNNHGLIVVSSKNIVVERIDSSTDHIYGIALSLCRRVSISVLSMSGCSTCVLLDFIENVNLTNVTIVDAYEITINRCSFVNVANVNILNAGLSLTSSFAVNFSSVSLNNSEYTMLICYCTKVQMTSITVKHTSNGLMICNSYDLHFDRIVLELNEVGITFTYCILISMFNISVKYNKMSGLEMWYSSQITIINASVANNKYQGVHLMDCNDAKLYNTTVHNNSFYDLQMQQTADIEVISLNVSVNGILFLLCSNATISNVHIGSINKNGISYLSCVDVSLKNSIFSEVEYIAKPQPKAELDDVAIVSAHNTTLLVSNCQFINNNVSSIDASNACIEIEGYNLFQNISSKLGAAFILSGNTELIILEDCDIVFHNNYVTEYGGAIHIVTNEKTYTSNHIEDIIYRLPRFLVTTHTQCFLRVEGNRTNTARLTFINNTAEKGGDVLYGGLVATGYDGDWNCLLSFKNISDMAMQSSEQPFRRITSDPSRVCICGEEGPDFLTVVDPLHHSVYPGQTLTLSAAVVGQDFGTVTGYVYAQYLKSSPHVVEQDQQWIYFSNAAGCQEFRYTINSPCEDCETVLVLTTDRDRVVDYIDQDINHKLGTAWSLLMSEPNYNKQVYDYVHSLFDYDERLELWSHTNEYGEIVNGTIDGFYTITSYDNGYDSAKLYFPQEIYKYPLYIHIDIQECPTGFSLHNSTCDCSSILQVVPTVVCDIENQTVSHHGSVWVGFYGYDSLAVSDYCPLNYCKKESVQVYLNSSDTDSQCKYMHSGVLCGGCQTGLSLALGSDWCLRCSNHYLLLVLAFALAGLAYVLVINILDLTVRQGIVNGFIFYASVIGANKQLFYSEKSVNPLTLFIAWFNLDLGIETCLYDGLTAYSRTWLQFVFPVYLWSIAGAIIIIAKYSRRMSALSGNNGVPVLATLFLLSYTKLLNIIISALSYTTLHTSSGPKYVWSIDGNIDYLSYKHLPLFVVAMLVLVFLWLPYMLLLVFGNYLQKLNFRFVAQNIFKLKPFLDINYAPLGDHHRYWFGVTLTVQAAILLASRTLPTQSTYLVVFSITVGSVMLLFWGQIVYKRRFQSLLHTSLFMNLAIIYATKLLTIQWQKYVYIASSTLNAIAVTTLIGYMLLEITKIITSKFCPRINRRDEAVEYEQIMMIAVNRNDTL